MSQYKEARELEVRGKYDVVVVGGGPSGVAAALAAARHKMSVLIIEKNVILGGLATGGHVCLFEPLCDGNGRQVTAGIVEEMLYTSIKYSYNTLPMHWKPGVRHVADPENCERLIESDVMEKKGRYCTLFNVPAFALAIEELVCKEGITISYDTLFCDTIMDGGSISAVIVEEASGRYVVECKAVVDTSGASLVFERSGAKCVLNTNHPTFEAYETNFACMREALETQRVERAIHWEVLGWNPVISDPKAPTDFLGTNAEDVTRFLLYTHEMALDNLKRKNVSEPGYAMLSIPTVPQIRMIRRIQGRYLMNPRDVFQTMEDSVGSVSDWRRAGPVYEIPYRCMVQSGYDNLIAAGRNIAAENDTWDLMRCYPGAMSTGQAAGTAAALAVQNRVSVNELNVKALQSALEKNGALLHIPAPLK